LDYKFVPMNKLCANEIAYSWKYSGVYSFYDMTADEEDLIDFIDEKNWDRHYFAVINNKEELIGYYLFYFEEEVMWVGFGIKPELTGMRLGTTFVMAGINFAVENFNYKINHIMLSVALFNKRAIRTYKKVGFQLVATYVQHTNGGQYQFIKMKKVI